MSFVVKEKERNLRVSFVLFLLRLRSNKSLSFSLESTFEWIKTKREIVERTTTFRVRKNQTRENLIADKKKDNNSLGNFESIRQRDFQKKNQNKHCSSRFSSPSRRTEKFSIFSRWLTAHFRNNEEREIFLSISIRDHFIDDKSDSLRKYSVTLLSFLFLSVAFFSRRFFTSTFFLNEKKNTKAPKLR